VNPLKSIPAKKIQAVAAMLLLQVNLALAVEPAPIADAAASRQAPAPAAAQLAPAQIPFEQLLRPSRNPINAYRGKTVPPPSMTNSVRLSALVRDGKIYLSLRDAIDLALENNLDMVIARYNLPIAQMDVQRTRAGGDERLHDLYTIGVGGHLNPGDGWVLDGLAREWSEELDADFLPSFEFIGLLNDDTVEVGVHHLGVVYLADAAGRSVGVRETHKLSGSFEELGAVRAVYERMETWSQLALDAIVGSGAAPRHLSRSADRDIPR